MPIYKVNTPSGEKLVDAKTKASAINHVIKNEVTAVTVGASEIVDLMQNGATVEKAGDVVAFPTTEETADPEPANETLPAQDAIETGV